MSDITTLKKYKVILEEFDRKQDKMLTAYDEILKERLSLSPKQIDRLIKELMDEFDNIIEIEGTRRKTYKLLKPIDLFVEAFDKSEEIAWLFNMVHDGDPEVFKKLEQFTNKSKHIYQFKNTPFEDIQSLEKKDIFKKLKRTVKNREYAKITFSSDETIDNIKCLKLIFIDNNWYLANVAEDNILRLSRISFIKKVDYATKINSFQLSSIEKQLSFLENNLQNAMSKYGEKTKIAKLKASGVITKYFEKGMKKFVSSQQYKEKLSDGSIIFTVEYTQYLEILPWIQSWMPNLIILEPQDLKEEYKNKLTETLNKI